MSQVRVEIVESMKSDLLSRVDEWVGVHVPAEGTEDYETWRSKLTQIGTIENIQDVIEYLENEGIDIDDFFLCGEYEVLSAGLDPSDVPANLITELGELVAEQSWTGGSCINIYLFDGKYFIVNEEEMSAADTETEAFMIAGIENTPFDQITHSQIHPASPSSTNKIAVTRKDPNNLARSSRRAVLIIVTNWPDGTMAFKFGGAMQSALRVSKEDMNLVQMAPERIFRVETNVNEAEFREEMESCGVASGGRVLFVEILES